MQRRILYGYKMKEKTSYHQHLLCVVPSWNQSNLPNWNQVHHPSLNHLECQEYVGTRQRSWYAPKEKKKTMLHTVFHLISKIVVILWLHVQIHFSIQPAWCELVYFSVSTSTGVYGINTRAARSKLARQISRNENFWRKNARISTDWIKLAGLIFVCPRRLACYLHWSCMGCMHACMVPCIIAKTKIKGVCV